MSLASEIWDWMVGLITPYREAIGVLVLAGIGLWLFHDTFGKGGSGK